MTNSEFSDTFTTLLNSYNTQASFGEQASKREIVLDEYEKSVLLTQAQDIIVKSYFDSSMNQQGQGFDDSTRRQMDFSSLIKVAKLKAVVPGTGTQPQCFDERGLLYQMPRKYIGDVEQSNTTDVLFILNEKLTWRESENYWTRTGFTNVTGDRTDEVAQTLINQKEYTDSNEVSHDATYCDSISEAVSVGWVFHSVKPKEYVIVPINYKEYDREMSKPYAQPLKKQAWRLFQNQATGFDINTELIPRFNVGPKDANGDHNLSEVWDQFTYIIRYVKRPRPIILESLPHELEIDGEREESSCELNPIIHMDILNKAVELAIATRSGGAAEHGVRPNNSMQVQWP